MTDLSHRPGPQPGRWLALVVIATAILMIVLDVSIINIALPVAQAELGISDANRAWVVTAYALTFGGLLLLGGRFADLVGRKRTFIIGLVGFAAASALGGFAGSEVTLIAARALQGIFGALLAPSALSLLTTTFTEPGERAKAFAVYGAVQGMGGAVGLLLGGALTEYLSWRWCLFINVPISLVVILAARNSLAESRVDASPGLDVAGAALSVFGLGTMGAPMANHLMTAGHQLFLHSRSGVPESLLKAGGVACATPAQVAEAAETIFLMMSDTPHVEAVLFGENGVAKSLSPGKTVVDMSSISPIATKEFAARIRDLGCDYVDAPVSGGEVGAKAASLTIMCGGSQDAFERVRPLLEVMGENITLIGGNGDGQTCKVANQIIVALNIEAVAEALVFASKAGADPAKVRKALMGGFAASRILEVHGERMINRTFDPGFRIELHQKDLGLALDSAKAIGVSLPNAAMAQNLMNVCVAQQGAGWDHSAMVRAIEIMANHKVA